ncbi:MmcQ/YjbR family DNA-binding protein [Winogradskyella sp. J14-2]|uniref:MmcQ/YjbR family DNA-binding protein n=1 Tax=Winogradskyella sp. J14-2 TaxID=1936080 RepID=UPI002936E037|nr:MmcQ/YjbR family DNA-binding protein [Winogradskyella sp. J14-2]
MKKKEVTEHFPFDDDVLVFKVCNKMFALASLSKWENEEGFINLKCNPDHAEELRAEFEGVTPGYHMHKKLWNSVKVHNTDISTKHILELIDHSYDEVVKSLPKKIRDNL